METQQINTTQKVELTGAIREDQLEKPPDTDRSLTTAIRERLMFLENNIITAKLVPQQIVETKPTLKIDLENNNEQNTIVMEKQLSNTTQTNRPNEMSFMQSKARDLDRRTMGVKNKKQPNIDHQKDSPSLSSNKTIKASVLKELKEQELISKFQSSLKNSVKSSPKLHKSLSPSKSQSPVLARSPLQNEKLILLQNSLKAQVHNKQIQIGIQNALSVHFSNIQKHMKIQQKKKSKSKSKTKSLSRSHASQISKQQVGTNIAQEYEEIKLNKKVNKLTIENNLLRDKLKLVNYELDQILKQHSHKLLTKKKKKGEKKRMLEKYLMTLDSQCKINEKYLDQLAHEKVKLELRNEQFSDVTYLNSLLRQVESVDVEISNMKNKNKSIKVSQKHIINHIMKYQEDKDTNQIGFEQTIKVNGDELQRIHWKISEKERIMSIQEEKQMAVMIQLTKNQQRYIKLKKEHDQLSDQITQPRSRNGHHETPLFSDSPTHQNQDIIQFETVDSGGTGGNPIDQETIKKMNRKLNVYQWSKTSKVNYYKTAIKNNEKIIKETIFLKDEKTAQLGKLNNDLHILTKQIKYMEEIMPDSGTKLYGFQTTQDLKKASTIKSNKEYHGPRSSSADQLVNNFQKILTINNSHTYLPPIKSKAISKHSPSKSIPKANYNQNNQKIEIQIRNQSTFKTISQKNLIKIDEEIKDLTPIICDNPGIQNQIEALQNSIHISKISEIPVEQMQYMTEENSILNENEE